MEAAGGHAPLAVGLEGGGPRLLGLLSDERLVGRVRAGSEQAFAILYKRHHAKILSFCRHMLGSSVEAEDAVQQAFANAYRDLLRGDRRLNFRPWLYRIARNQCISMLRSRRPQVELDQNEPSLVGLSEEVAGRADLRDLLRDLSALPHDQREALLLSELYENSHAEVAEIIGCDREKVKSLVFQARSSLLKSREAREISCEEIQRQLSVLSGGALRRGVIRRHLGLCESCRAFRSDVRRQRQALAIVLPVIPSAALKLGAANAIAAAGAAAAVTGSGGGVAAGPVAALAGKLGISAVAAKGAAATVAVTVAAGGGAVAVTEIRDSNGARPAPQERQLESGAPSVPALPSPVGRNAAGDDLRARGGDRERQRPGGSNRAARSRGASSDGRVQPTRPALAERARQRSPRKARLERRERQRAHPLRLEQRGGDRRPVRKRPVRKRPAPRTPARTAPALVVPTPPAEIAPRDRPADSGTTGPTS